MRWVRSEWQASCVRSERRCVVHLRFFAPVIAVVWMMLGGGMLPAFGQDDSPTYLPLITHEYTPGWQWGEALTVTVSARTSTPPLAAIDRDGQPHLFWHDTSLDNQVHHTFLAGDGWRDAIPSQGIEGDSSVALAPLVEGSGLIHLIWRNRVTTDDPPYRYLHATFDDDNWSQPTQVFRFLYPTTKGWLRMDAQDQPRVGITTGFLSTRGVILGLQGSWQPIADFSLPSFASVVWSDAIDGAHLFGNDASTLQYWRWLSNVPSAAQVLGSGRLTGRTITFDRFDNLHMAWTVVGGTRAATATLLHHQCIDSQRVLLPVSYPGGAESVREMAVAGEHGPLYALAWQEPARKRVMLWDGCTPGSIATIPESGQPATTLRAVAVSSDPRSICAFMQQGATAVYTVRCATLGP